MNKNVYKNKETGKVVITSEKLSSKHWTKIGVRKNMLMDKSKVNTK